MSDKKISDLIELDTAATNDKLYIVDTSSNQSKQIQFTNLLKTAGLTGTAIYSLPQIITEVQTITSRDAAIQTAAGAIGAKADRTTVDYLSNVFNLSAVEFGSVLSDLGKVENRTDNLGMTSTNSFPTPTVPVAGQVNTFDSMKAAFRHVPIYIGSSTFRLLLSAEDV